MKYFVILFGFFLLFGFAGNSFAQYMGNNDSSEITGERIGVGLTRDITWPPPIKQIKQFEFEPENVKCNSGLELIFKISGSPACVKPETKIKLIERGWNQSISKSTFDKKWTFHTQGKVSSINISGDGEMVAVGTKIEDTQKGMLYLLDGNGLPLWQHEFERMISNVAISQDSNRILANGYHLCGGGGGAIFYCEPSSYLYDVKGNQLWSYIPEEDESFNSVSLSPNGTQVIFNTYNDILYFNVDKEASWIFNTNKSVQESMFLDDYTIVANTDDSIIALNNKGENLWNFTREYQNSYAMAVSEDGQYAVSADDSVSDDSYVYLLDSNGDLLWNSHVGISVLDLSFSDDSSRILVQTNSQFMTYDLQGNLLWKNNIPSDVTISSNGSFLVGTTFNQGSGASITIFDAKGNIVSNYPTTSNSLSHMFSLAHNDRTFAIAESKNQVSVFEINYENLDSDVLFDLYGLQNSEELHVEIIPQGKSLFDVTIQQGDSLEIPWDIKIDDGYTTNNFGVSIKSSSPDLESWITPMDPYVTINGVPPGKRIITLHPPSELEAKDYTVQILGNGDSMHKETGWLTELEDQILGTINVKVIPKQSSLSIKVGAIHSEMENFCVDMTDGNGQFCSGGPKYQIIPITVFSNTAQLVKLKSFVVQEGGWIKFVAQEFIAGPDGTTINMIMAGYLVPVRNNPLSDKSLVIQAVSETDSTTTTLPVRFGTISVINDEPGSIKLGKIRTNSNGTNFSVSGVVYDPTDLNPEESVYVNLSVGGLWDGEKTVDLPSWLRIEIPEPSFVLNATTPYHFMITARTINAPESGNYFVVINQNINGIDFVELEELVIENIRH